MRRKLLSTLLALAMVLSLLPASALAAVTQIDDTETYWDDATESFRIYDDYWADLVTAQPAGYAADADAKTVTISTPEALVWWAKQVNDGTSFAGYTVSLTADIDLSGHYWTPIDTATIEYVTGTDGSVSWKTVEPTKKLDGVIIDGGGYTVTGLATATGLRGPAQPSEPGDGQNCYYYSAFIGRNDGALTIQNISFDRASIAMTEPAEGVATNATSMCAVVTANNSGALTLKSVTVSNARVLAMQKVSALLGMPSGGSFTVEQCAVTGCDIQAYFIAAPICGYVGTAGYPLAVNGIKLEGNTTTLIRQGGQWTYTTYNGAAYYGHPTYYGAGNYYIGAAETAVMENTDEFTMDGITYSGYALPLVAEVNGYQYSTLSAAVEAAEAGDTVMLLQNYEVPAPEEFIEYNLPESAVLDLGGNTLTVPYAAAVFQGENITIQNGRIISEANYGLWIGNGTRKTSATVQDLEVICGINVYEASVTLKNVTADASGAVYYAVWGDENSDITIESGSYTKGNTPYSVYVYGGDDYPGKITINGGSFAGAVGVYDPGSEPETKYLTVTGGLFDTDPTAYLADGLAAVDSGDPVYHYTVGRKGDTPAQVVTAPADVNVSDEISEDVKNFANEFSQALTDTNEGGSAQPGIGEALEAAASTQAQQNEVTTNTVVEGAQTVLGALENATGVYGIVADTVAIVIQPYLDIQITGATDDESGKTVTLDITPMYITVATTANVGEGDDIVLDAEGGTVNAVQVGEPQVLPITKSVDVTLSLPNGFAGNGDFYVRHTASNGRTYYYTGTVESNVLTFTNPHGFSQFTLLGSATPSEMVAQLNGVGYTTLQEAVNNAADGDTVTVLTGGLSATVTGASRTIYLKNGTGGEITVTLNGTRVDLEASGTGDYTYTRPTGGGSGVTNYAVTVEKAANGTVTASPSYAAKGTTVTLTVAADEGYELSSLTVTDGSGNAVSVTKVSDTQYTFAMPASRVTVEASFTQATPEALPFADVAQGDWYYNAVDYVYRNGLMTGVSDTTFEPDTGLTRGMMVTMLWAMEGGPVVNYAMDYTDVDQGAWYAEAVRWASAEGVSNGYGDGTFAPDRKITREEMAVMLYAYAVCKGYDVTQGGMALREYGDYDSISDWALNALGWTVNAGIMGGKPGNLMDPGGAATRAEAATILMNFHKLTAQ